MADAPDHAGIFVTDGIGVGAYPAATVESVAGQAPLLVLVMGTDANERHDFTRELRPRLPHGALIGRRRFKNDGRSQFDGQLDLSKSPQDEARRWFAIVLGGLTPAEFLTVYDFAVGANEIWDNSKPETWQWLADFELALCRLLQAVGIPYACVKAAPGNLDPATAVKFLGPLFAEAALWAMDHYCRPDGRDFDPPENPWYARRPFAIWQAMKAAGMRVPSLVGSEIGPWDSPRHYGMDEGAWVALLTGYPAVYAAWRAAGMDVLGGIYFADGAEGTDPPNGMGYLWNLGPDGQHAVGEWNRQSGILVPTKPTYPNVPPTVKPPPPKPKPGRKPMVDIVLPYPVQLKLTKACDPGPRAETKHAFAHCTGGPTNSLQEDYDGTIGWFLNPANQASAHLLFGPATTARFVHDDDLSWHARYNNHNAWGAEWAMPAKGVAQRWSYTDYQYTVGAEAYRLVCEKYSIPKKRVMTEAQAGIIGHQDSEQGKADGKLDPGLGVFDWPRFIGLVNQLPAVPPVSHPAATFDIGPGFVAYLTAHPEFGTPRQNAWSDSFGDTFVWTNPTPQHPHGTLLVWRKDLNLVEALAWG